MHGTCIKVKLHQESGSHIQIGGGRKRHEAGSVLRTCYRSAVVLWQIAARGMWSDNIFFLYVREESAAIMLKVSVANARHLGICELFDGCVYQLRILLGNRIMYVSRVI